MGVGDNDAVRFAELEVCVVAEETAAVGLFIGFHVCYFERGLFGDAGGGPDLAVWVGVGAAHCGALVFEDLHVGVLVFWRGDSEGGGRGGVERGGGGEVGCVEGGPGADDGEDGRGGEVGEGEVVGGVEADYVAFAFGGGCAEEEGGFVCRAGVSR